MTKMGGNKKQLKMTSIRRVSESRNSKSAKRRCDNVAHNARRLTSENRNLSRSGNKIKTKRKRKPKRKGGATAATASMASIVSEMETPFWPFFGFDFLSRKKSQDGGRRDYYYFFNSDNQRWTCSIGFVVFDFSIVSKINSPFLFDFFLINMVFETKTEGLDGLLQ